MVTLRDVLKNIYYNPSHPASYGGIQALYRAVKDDGRVKPTIPAIKHDWSNKIPIPCINFQGGDSLGIGSECLVWTINGKLT